MNTKVNSYNGSSQHLINVEKARKAAVALKFKCQYCNEERVKANIKKHETSCYLNPANIKACVVCDNPIKNYRKSTTCSYSCSNTHFRSGINHGNWKENTYRTTCAHYHDFKCVICDESNVVEVHHLDEDHTNNKPENLIPMCPTHHQYWHSRFKHLIENKVTEYIADWKSRQSL